MFCGVKEHDKLPSASVMFGLLAGLRLLWLRQRSKAPVSSCRLTGALILSAPNSKTDITVQLGWQRLPIAASGGQLLFMCPNWHAARLPADMHHSPLVLGVI